MPACLLLVHDFIDHPGSFPEGDLSNPPNWEYGHPIVPFFEQALGWI